MKHEKFTDEQQIMFENLETAVNLNGNDFAEGYKMLLTVIRYRNNKELSTAYESMPEADRRAVISDYCLPF